MYFGYINQWPHLTDDDMKRMDVSNPNHPNHTDFLTYIKRFSRSGEIEYIYNPIGITYYTLVKIRLEVHFGK